MMDAAVDNSWIETSLACAEFGAVAAVVAEVGVAAVDGNRQSSRH